MTKISEVTHFLGTLCPPILAEDWDNTGLLLGDPELPVEAIMACLTLTRKTCREAIDKRANLVVCHHPMPFRPVRCITTVSQSGRILWELANHGIAVYSPHTAFDSCESGINAMLARMVGLHDVRPLRPLPQDPLVGAGRMGCLEQPVSLLEFAHRVKEQLGVKAVQLVGRPEASVSRVAVACGAAGELLDDARACGCDVIVLGEARYHTCLEAEFWGIGMVLVGHYASERRGVEKLAEILRQHFPQLKVWASEQESDPMCWV